MIVPTASVAICLFHLELLLTRAGRAAPRHPAAVGPPGRQDRAPTQPRGHRRWPSHHRGERGARPADLVRPLPAQPHRSPPSTNSSQMLFRRGSTVEARAGRSSSAQVGGSAVLTGISVRADGAASRPTASCVRPRRRRSAGSRGSLSFCWAGVARSEAVDSTAWADTMFSQAGGQAILANKECRSRRSAAITTKKKSERPRGFFKIQVE